MKEGAKNAFSSPFPLIIYITYDTDLQPALGIYLTTTFLTLPSSIFKMLTPFTGFEMRSPEAL